MKSRKNYQRSATTIASWKTAISTCTVSPSWLSSRETIAQTARLLRRVTAACLIGLYLTQMFILGHDVVDFLNKPAYIRVLLWPYARADLLNEFALGITFLVTGVLLLFV